MMGEAVAIEELDPPVVDADELLFLQPSQRPRDHLAARPHHVGDLSLRERAAAATRSDAPMGLDLLEEHERDAARDLPEAEIRREGHRMPEPGCELFRGEGGEGRCLRENEIAPRLRQDEDCSGLDRRRARRLWSPIEERHLIERLPGFDDPKRLLAALRVGGIQANRAARHLEQARRRISLAEEHGPGCDLTAHDELAEPGLEYGGEERATWPSV